MKISMHAMAVKSFVPMLESLTQWLGKGAAHAKANNLDLVNARLAPDMFTLAQQVQQACYYARDGVARLTGQASATMEGAETTLPGLEAQIARTLDQVRGIPAGAFDGAEERDCSIPIANDMIMKMDGLDFLRAWALPHFYFHVVTAYDILRHSGVVIGKQDYLSEVGGFIRPASSA
jgi:hypothetical protein